MAEVALFFKVKLKDGALDEFLDAFRPVVGDVRANEPGTLEYRMHTGLGDPSTVWFYERYADDAAMQAHAANAKLMETFAKIGPLMDGAPEMQPGSILDV
jgi:quinol monooxygenase YgiN